MNESLTVFLFQPIQEYRGVSGSRFGRVPSHAAEGLPFYLEIASSFDSETTHNMQAAFDITTKYCRKEMEAYGSCVASNPSTWQQTCNELKMKVAHCTSSHPVIQMIRQSCSKEFVEFENCLRENQDTPTSCSPHVARFVACAETVDLSQVDTGAMPQPS